MANERTALETELIKALEFYAAQGSYMRDEVEAGGAPAYVPGSEPVLVDCGAIAIAALSKAEGR